MTISNGQTIEARIQAGINVMQEQDPSTAGQIESALWGLEQWDIELNKAYKTLMDNLPAGAKSRLQAAQRQWLVFRDAEFALSDTIYGSLQGTMYRPMSVFSQLEFVKDRTLRLLNYDDLIG